MSENHQIHNHPTTPEEEQQKFIDTLKLFIEEQESFLEQLQKDWGSTKISSMDLHILLTAQAIKTKEKCVEVNSRIVEMKEKIHRANDSAIEEIGALDNYKGVLEGLNDRFKEDTVYEGAEVETINFLNGFREMIEKNTTSPSAVLGQLYKEEFAKKFSVEQLTVFIAMSSNLFKQKEKFETLLNQTLKER